MFQEKGYSGARTRDIADAAGVNLALLNYHFQGKENLFNLIMLESIQGFFQSLMLHFNDESTSLEVKIEAFVSSYIDVLISEPGIPLFVLSELRSNPEALLQKFGIQEFLMQSVFIRQLILRLANSPTNKGLHPLHFVANILGLCVFPFIASPLLKGLGSLSQSDFNSLMQERKVLIPKWVNAMLNER